MSAPHLTRGLLTAVLYLASHAVALASPCGGAAICERTLIMGHAHLDLGPRTCTDQRERCISYRQMHGPMGSEGVCVRVFRACMRSGIWDATAAFPYGGVRITGMIRR